MTWYEAMADNSERVTLKQPEELIGEMTEAKIDRILAESFPASDPPSWTLGIDREEQVPTPKPDPV